jgi:hypothetical protein
MGDAKIVIVMIKRVCYIQKRVWYIQKRAYVDMFKKQYVHLLECNVCRQSYAATNIKAISSRRIEGDISDLHHAAVTVEGG